MAAHTKHYQTFTNRLLHLNADLELVDIIDSAMKSGALTTCDEKLFDALDEDKHVVLSNRTASAHNRQIAINHLRQSVYSSYIKDLYEEVTDYLHSALAEAATQAQVDPGRFIGEHRVEVQVPDVLQAGKLQVLIEDIVAKMFRKLENERSTTSLINKSCSKLGLNVDQAIRDKAIYYLEIRHQLVHADGKADALFKANHPDLAYTSDDYIDLRFKLIKNIREAVEAFIEEFDNQAITAGINFSHNIPVA